MALNFRAAVYRGKPVLTWWEGKTEHGLGEGTHVILDETYREVARIPAGGGRPSDLHEFLLTSRGTALVTAWERVPMDLSRVGGPSSGVVVGGIVQELELPSGRVLFEWRSLDHVARRGVALGRQHEGAYDYFHINSIELDADGNFLVSARNTWAVYKIDRGSGDVIWRLGGKKSDFTMGPGTRLRLAARRPPPRRADQLVSLFDDGAAPQVQPQSKALVLALDTTRMRATLHRKYTHRPTGARARARQHAGPPERQRARRLGHRAVALRVHAPAASSCFDAHLPHGGQNYRAPKMPWHGRPTEPPAIATRRRGGHGYVYASWNGATEVHSWRLESGASALVAADGRRHPQDRLRDRVARTGGRALRRGRRPGRARPAARPLADGQDRLELGSRPQVPVKDSPGSSTIRSSPVRKAFGGQVIGSTARLRRSTSGSGSPVKSIRYR